MEKSANTNANVTGMRVDKYDVHDVATMGLMKRTRTKTWVAINMMGEKQTQK